MIVRCRKEPIVLGSKIMEFTKDKLYFTSCCSDGVYTIISDSGVCEKLHTLSTIFELVRQDYFECLVNEWYDKKSNCTLFEYINMSERDYNNWLVSK